MCVQPIIMSARPTHKYDIPISASDLAAREMELLYFERMAIEDSTRATMNSVVRCYVQFCESARIPAFPVTFRSLGLYLVQYCHRYGHTTRSIPGIISHLKRANREHSAEWMDDASQARLDDLKAGLQKFDRSTPARKLPVTHKVLADVQRVADMSNAHYYQVITMGRLAHDALLRGVELIALKLKDIEWSSAKDQVTVNVHLSKANKVGSHEKIIIMDYGESSAVAFLRQYYHVMGFDQEDAKLINPLWPVIASDSSVNWVQAYGKDPFVGMIRHLLGQAGYQGTRYSGHSFRSGGATDLWNSHRCRPLVIKLFGRWKSDAYRLYIRDNPQCTAVEVAAALAFFDEAANGGVMDASPLAQG